MTVPDLAQPSGYAHVVVATGTPLLTTAGAVPLDEEGNFVRSGDVRAQARHTLHNLMRQLAVAGASGDDLLETTVYVASTDRADPVACWEEIQRSPLAAMVSTLLGAALLDYADQPDEIEPTAVLPWRDPTRYPEEGGLHDRVTYTTRKQDRAPGTDAGGPRGVGRADCPDSR